MNTTKIIEFGGIITLDDMSHLDQSSDPSFILDDLKEDLFQASFPLGQILDIGWYPEFCERGCFIVALISEQNWDTPIHLENASTWKELERAIQNTLEKISQKAKTLSSGIKTK
jgi:hypothetical protein